MSPTCELRMEMEEQVCHNLKPPERELVLDVAKNF